MGESLTGDVYAEPSRWRELSLGGLFSEGWNEPWASPPAGEEARRGRAGSMPTTACSTGSASRRSTSPTISIRTASSTRAA